MSKPQLLRYEEWRAGSGYYYCNDLSDLTSVRSLWWVPARLLNMELDNFVEMLINKFKVDNISFDGKTLTYSWKNISDMRTYKNFINRKAREGNWVI